MPFHLHLQGHSNIGFGALSLMVLSYLGFVIPDWFFGLKGYASTILLINVKLLANFGILAFMSRINVMLELSMEKV